VKPVVNEQSSDASHAAIAAASSARPIRRIGIFSTTAFIASGALAIVAIASGVSNSVGAIALTVSPVVASSLPRLFVYAMTPHLAAEYAACYGLPSLPAIDETLMMRPQPRRIIGGANARQQ
jgi:hypothetical protein